MIDAMALGVNTTTGISMSYGESFAVHTTGLAPYTVTGSHTYASTGTFTVKTTINDDGGSNTSAICTVTVFAFATSNGASFVIGDLEASIGNHVT
jgi:hypothetical protein